MSEFPLVDNTVFDPEDEYRPEPEPEPLAPLWMDGSPRIGIHTSIGGSHINALESARKLGCNALQIFSASPRMWQMGSVRIQEQDGKAFRARRQVLRGFKELRIVQCDQRLQRRIGPLTPHHTGLP